jgi:hypothetical protein
VAAFHLDIGVAREPVAVRHVALAEGAVDPAHVCIGLLSTSLPYHEEVRRIPIESGESLRTTQVDRVYLTIRATFLRGDFIAGGGGKAACPSR